MFVKTAIVLALAFIGCAIAVPLSAQRIASMQEFIRTVPLAAPRSSYGLGEAGIQTAPNLNTTDKQKQGFVVEGQLVPFTANVRGPSKDDVLNGCLFAQLAADYIGDREKEGEAWYKQYSAVMSNLGWVIQDFNFVRYNVGGSKFTMDAVVLDIILAIATDEEAVVAKEVIAGLKSLEDKDNRIVLFERSTYDNQAGNFMLSPVDQSANGDVVMGIGGFQFSSSETATRFLFWEYDSGDTKIYKSTQIITLDETIYNANRATVISRLGDNAVKGTKLVPLKSLPGE